MEIRVQLKTNIRTVAEDSSILPNACRVLVTVAVLILLPFLASTTAHAQAPAGPNRPSEVPDGYVITPSGYFHPSCVRQLAEGETLLEGGRVLQHADGTAESVPVCAYPHYTARGEILGRWRSAMTTLNTRARSRAPHTARLPQPGPCPQRRLPIMTRLCISFPPSMTATTL